MPRFVVLRHETPPGYREGSHWDLMLEHNGVLRTWALDHWPVENGNTRATDLPDHRLAYLAYEGPVSNSRGEVTRVDQGTFDWQNDAESEITVVLKSEQATYLLELRPIAEENRYDVYIQPLSDQPR